MDIRENNLRKIESGAFSNCPEMEVLILESNKLSAIDYKLFSGLEKLNILNLRNNLIVKIENFFLEDCSFIEE